MKEYYLKLITKIIYKEFNKLFVSLNKEFKKNYDKKRNNFIIDALGDKNIAYFAFVSSFESKYGNSMENVAKKIARLRYKKKYINLINTQNMMSNYICSSTQNVITNLDLDNPIVDSQITNYLSTYQGNGTISSTLDNNVIRGLLSLYNNPNLITQNAHYKPVDLAFYDDNNILNLIELKAGGELDSSNGPKNIEKLLKIYVAANDNNAKIYFATLYNKSGIYLRGARRGQKKTWTGSAKKYLKFPDMFLIEKQFWEKILPGGITFEEFAERYNIILSKMNIDKIVSDLIEETCN